MSEAPSLHDILDEFTPVRAERGQDGLWHRDVSFDTVDISREEELALGGETEEQQLANLWQTYEETLQSFSDYTGVAIVPYEAQQNGIDIRVASQNILGEQFVTDFSAIEASQGWKPFAIEPTADARTAFVEALPKIAEWTQKRAEAGEWILRETAFPSNYVLSESGQLNWVDMDATVGLPAVNPFVYEAQQAELEVLAAAL